MELLLEANSGIAGDMTIAALLDLGMEPARLEAELRKLALEEPWTLHVERVKRHGIVANHVSFRVDGKAIEEPYLASDELAGTQKEHSHDGKHAHPHDHAHDHSHPHEHPHDHEHAHSHNQAHGAHGHEHSHDHDHAHGWHYAAIRTLIETSGLSSGAKQKALAVFEKIAVAEAKLHGVTVDEVHFHEVGSLDAILDICGTAVLLDLLGVTKLYCMPLPVGQGNAKMAHGVLPLPAPATLEILKGMPLRRVPYRFETVTPTGAAIVAALASHDTPASYTVEKIGYGAGTKDPAEVANLLRVYEIKTESAAMLETIAVLETTLDDATGEWAAHLTQKLRDAGALDVFATPVQMKKGRLGVNVTVLANPGDADRLSELCFAESTTIGVRRRTESRWALPRQAAKVNTPWGQVAVKIVTLPDGRKRATPEYDSCVAIAAATGTPLLEVYRAAAAQTEFVE